jgi:hypothetical protein
MNRLSSIRLKVLPGARSVFVLMMLVACLSSSVPLIASASGSMCERPCCAGTAPHAAGSCMNGACHAAITHSKTSGHAGRIASRPEHLCGSPSRIETQSSGRVRPVQQFSRTSADQTSLSPASVMRPCQPECGGCSASSTNSNQRNSATIAYAERPRPPSDVRLADLAYRSSQMLDALSRHCAPRGPPLSFQT